MSIMEEIRAQKFLEDYANGLYISTVAEARERLIKLGVLLPDGDIAPEYRDIIKIKSSSKKNNETILTARLISEPTILYFTVIPRSLIISFVWGSIKNNLSTGDGIVTIKINGEVKVIKEISQGQVYIDLASFICEQTEYYAVELIVKDTFGLQKNMRLQIVRAK